MITAEKEGDLYMSNWTECLPNCREYELSGNYNPEVYLDAESGEIWVPVRKK